MMYMSNEPPVYVDWFWEVRQLIDAWNVNMAHNFSPSWINAIDELMSKWVSEYTCPGLMYVPCKLTEICPSRRVGHFKAPC